ncbi:MULTISPECIES: VOC family protein [unclassified Pseudoalteromonas]|uniref:VOC family protein n=1 Tax=unclassified Pseudoalteromonas TaxID=194690 RepID=UPI0020984F1D|nr:VOC family protein [Pseudoalteromonas sp. XMcav2-N]MCO7190799.1 VOC family protein [Pseudoalteromonas sp. XMcav2-N]
MEQNTFKRLDHIAVAVRDLDSTMQYYQDILGMKVIETRVTKGVSSGMRSCVLDAGAFSIVLIQGTDENSQVCRYIERYGQGVQHVAFEVDDLERSAAALAEKGMSFSTDVINGQGLKQIFSRRNECDGMMYELIQRTGETGFQEESVHQLFNQLERHDEF